MPRLATLLLLVAAAACGGKSSSSTSTMSNTGPEGPAGGGGAKLPWEAAFTEGATFTLVDGMTQGDPDAEPLTIKVTSVEDNGNERIYTLAWSDAGNGLQQIIVRGDLVTFNDTKAEDMQDPFETPVGMCYGEDLSNPDGCEDVCDGHICMDASGIVTVSGLYAPGYSEYVAK